MPIYLANPYSKEGAKLSSFARYERIITKNLLQDHYTSDKDLFYRREDGFRTMIKHPTLSPEEIEDIQKWCFEEDFQRLGPSIYRVLEARLVGYQELKHSPNPLLRAKADYYASELRYAYPVFLAGRLLGPNATVRCWIGDLEQRIHVELGHPTLGQRRKSGLAVAAAFWTGLKLKLDLFQHPKLTRTAYRIPGKRWGTFDAWEELHRKFSSSHFSIQVELQHAKQQVWMRLEGVLSPKAPNAWPTGSVNHWPVAKTTWCSTLRGFVGKGKRSEAIAREVGKLSFTHPSRPPQVVSNTRGVDPTGRHLSGLPRLINNQLRSWPLLSLGSKAQHLRLCQVFEIFIRHLNDFSM